MSRGAAIALLGASVLGACQGETGTIALGLVAAPGSTVLDRAERLRVELTNPPAVFEATRSPSGFQLALEVEATSESGALIVTAYDGDGALVATGASPPFPVAAIDARIVVYMAPPMSIETAPVALPSRRAQIAAAPLPYGALLAGGRDLERSEPSDAVAIYNAFDHTLAPGLAMPAARAGLAVGVGPGSRVYLFGGEDDAGGSTGTLWRFDTSVPPRGHYAELADLPEHARAGAVMVPIGSERFLVTGAPPLELTALGLSARDDLGDLSASGVAVTGADGVAAAVFAGAPGIIRFRDEAFTVLDPSPRPGAVTAALPGGEVLVIDAGASSAIRVDVVTGALVPVAGVVPADCPTPSLATTSRHLVLACEATTHVHTLATLAPVATIARGGVVLSPLPNDQVLLASGEDLALFSPPPPE